VHTLCKRELKRLFKLYYFKEERGDENRKVLDVGSFDVNGTSRGSVPRSWKYIGVDLFKGKNVDVVMPGPFEIPFPRSTFSAIVSSSCLEHCANPFRLVKEMARVLKPGGYIFMVAPVNTPEHREIAPIGEDSFVVLDCWRFYPDGFSCLFKEAKMKVIHTYTMRRSSGRMHCWGIAQK